MLSLDQVIHDIRQSKYKLDMASVAGLLGGDSAVDALETIHLYEGRRWAGWYNYPGTVRVAKRFGQMASSPVWDGVFPGPNETPATTFRLAGKSGPEYNGSFSGTKLCTGYLGYLVTQNSLRAGDTSKELVLEDPARKTESSPTIVVISLSRRQLDKHEPRLVSRVFGQLWVALRCGRAPLPENSDSPGLIPVNPESGSLALCSIVPSLVSIGAGILCIFAHDPLCTSLIYLGILCSGFSSLVLGTAALRIRFPVPSEHSPPGDGLMIPDDGSLIVLKGAEKDVNIVTKGEFDLDYSHGIWPDKKKKYNTIGFSSVLLYLQFLVQLLLVPSCTLFGQILFLISWIVSAGYHLYVGSRKREDLHWELLSRVLSANMRKWTLGTRTQMAVFACLAIGDGHEDPLKSSPETVLDRIIPDDTKVWKYWKNKVVKELKRFWISGSTHYFPTIHFEPASDEMEEYTLLTDDDKNLLVDVVGDAWYAFNKYPSMTRELAQDPGAK